MIKLGQMWICAIVPEKFREVVTQLCLAENKSIGLPENVFKLPLHISLKKSFYTEDFDSLKEDMLQVMDRTGRFCCHTAGIKVYRNMLWLALENEGTLRLLHEELDRLLETKYHIPISKFDRVFQPHISLFTRGTPEQIKAMYDKLSRKEFGTEMEISQFVIGSSGHKDCFFSLNERGKQ